MNSQSNDTYFLSEILPMKTILPHFNSFSNENNFQLTNSTQPFLGLYHKNVFCFAAYSLAMLVDVICIPLILILSLRKMKTLMTHRLDNKSYSVISVNKLKLLVLQALIIALQVVVYFVTLTYVLVKQEAVPSWRDYVQ